MGGVGECCGGKPPLGVWVPFRKGTGTKKGGEIAGRYYLSHKLGKR